MTSRPVALLLPQREREPGVLAADAEELRAREATIFDLPVELKRQDLEPPMAKHRRERPSDPGEELALIQRVLADTGGNRAKAARVLGISRVTLWKRMRRLTGAAPESSHSEASA